MNLGAFFTSAKALHFVTEATLHSKGICIYAYDAFGMPFILTFNKAAGCLFLALNLNVQGLFDAHIMFP